MNGIDNSKAKEYFYQKQYSKAIELFLKDENYYGAGLASLLLGNTTSAKKYWSKNKEHCPACNFGLSILDFIALKPAKIPSFFQTRAQLEIYLSLFIENGLTEWAENLISNCDNLYMANPESYKFIARALFANGYFKLAMQFCKKTIGIYYCDPEAFLILAQSYFLLGELGEALDWVNKTINMVPDYYPAILLKDVVKKEIENKRNNNN